MQIKEAIQKAIEGGWKKEFFQVLVPCVPKFDGNYLWIDTGTSFIDKIPFEAILLDPTFWQAIGKVEGWDTMRNTTVWQIKAQSFMKKRMQGQDINTAFNNATK